MKKCLLLILVALTFYPSNELIAQQEKTLYFYHDGDVDMFTCSDIDKISFELGNGLEWTIRRGDRVDRIPVDKVDSVCFVSYDAPLFKCPDSHHPHMIDLGIGTKWACCNVGATKPEGCGGYYAWGETSEKFYYALHTYQYAYQDNNGHFWDDDTQSRYSCRSLGSDISGTSYDVAHVRWGAPWCMPTKEDMEKLVNNCSHVWTTENGVYGLRFTGPNGGSIFLIPNGYRWEGAAYHIEWGFDYWSSTQTPDGSVIAASWDLSSGHACGLFNHLGNDNWFYNGRRWHGRVVRPVVRN